MIDLHCHVLPGLDDGPEMMVDSLELCRAAHAAGTRVIVATPHVNWEYPLVTPAVVHSAVQTLNEALRAAQIEIVVRPGAEVAISKAGELSDADLSLLRLGGGQRLLVECPHSGGGAVENVLRLLADRGHQIVLAHPERSPALRSNRGLLEALRDVGMVCCITARSLTRGYGRDAGEAAWELLGAGLVHAIASDAHGPLRRPPALVPELELAGLDSSEIEYFTRVGPQAILDGTHVPDPPKIKRRRLRRWFNPQRRRP